MPDPTREEIDAKIAASEARGAIDIVRLEGKLEAFAATLSGKMDALQTSIQNAAAYNRDTRSLIISSRPRKTLSAWEYGGIWATERIRNCLDLRLIGEKAGDFVRKVEKSLSSTPGL